MTTARRGQPRRRGEDLRKRFNVTSTAHISTALDVIPVTMYAYRIFPILERVVPAITWPCLNPQVRDKTPRKGIYRGVIEYKYAGGA
jgi:hypothetical protein